MQILGLGSKSSILSVTMFLWARVDEKVCFIAALYPPAPSCKINLWFYLVLTSASLGHVVCSPPTPLETCKNEWHPLGIGELYIAATRACRIETQSGLWCGVQTVDCFPLLLRSVSKRRGTGQLETIAHHLFKSIRQRERGAGSP